MTQRKKLIEVALPLEAINRACIEDKNRKTGHIRNLHKWFAPMPLPAWRAVLFASLIDDPGNELPDNEAERERHRLFQIIERLLPFEAINDQQTIADARAAIQQCLVLQRTFAQLIEPGDTALPMGDIGGTVPLWPVDDEFQHRLGVECTPGSDAAQQHLHLGDGQARRFF
jgi:hypothetical protein